MARVQQLGPAESMAAMSFLEESCIPDSGALTMSDMRFRALLGAEAWARLPAVIRARFAKRLGTGASVTYAGRIVESRKSFLGHLIARAAIIIGAPLPLSDDIGAPAVVTVTEDPVSGGQFWTRMYGRRRGFPQVIHSSKRFAGPTGLEEYLGCGFGIALRLRTEEDALHFVSDHFFVDFFGLRLRLPHWMAPGDLTISHVARGSEAFSFILSLHHPLFGEIVRQCGLFRERGSPLDKGAGS